MHHYLNTKSSLDLMLQKQVIFNHTYTKYLVIQNQLRRLELKALEVGKRKQMFGYFTHPPCFVRKPELVTASMQRLCTIIQLVSHMLGMYDYPTGGRICWVCQSQSVSRFKHEQLKFQHSSALLCFALLCSALTGVET